MVSRIAAGILLLVLTVPGLLCSLLILNIVICSKRLRKLIVYRILLQLCIAECVLLVGHVVTATMPLSNSNYGYWGHKILSAVLQSFYMAVLLLNALLAFNRLYINTSTGVKSTMGLYRVIIILCYIIVAFEIACYLTPHVATLYSLEYFSWAHDPSLNNFLMKWIVQQEKIIAFGAILFELACYVGIFFIIKRKRSAVLTSMSTPYNPEYRVLVTSIVAFVYQVVMIIPFHFGNKLFHGAEFVHLLNAATWAFFPAVHQISILFLNRELRRRLKYLIKNRVEKTYSAAHVSVAVIARRNSHNQDHRRGSHPLNSA